MSISQTPTSANFKHGLSGTRFYYVWSNMKRRCMDPGRPEWKYYGGKGIIVCEKWKTFSGFMDDMFDSYGVAVKEYGEKNVRIDRKNGAKNYEVGNCRWVSMKDSLQNRSYLLKYSNYMIMFEGKNECIEYWSENIGIPADTIINRIRKKGKNENVFDYFMVGGLFFPQIWKGEKTREEIISGTI